MQLNSSSFVLTLNLSPILEYFIAIIEIEHSKIGSKYKIKTNDDEFDCTIVEKPFYDPKKKIASS